MVVLVLLTTTILSWLEAPDNLRLSKSRDDGDHGGNPVTIVQVEHLPGLIPVHYSPENVSALRHELALQLHDVQHVLCVELVYPSAEDLPELPVVLDLARELWQLHPLDVGSAVTWGDRGHARCVLRLAGRVGVGEAVNGGGRHRPPVRRAGLVLVHSFLQRQVLVVLLVPLPSFLWLCFQYKIEASVLVNVLVWGPRPGSRTNLEGGFRYWTIYCWQVGRRVQNA